MTVERLTKALADRYRVERELGAGGMATVYLAHDLKHDRPVAIKVLHEDLGAALGPERFLAEIKTTARLQHAHILPLLDSGSTAAEGEAGGLLYYVMPYVAGESLRDRLRREKQLPIDDAVRIAREVADALGHAHGHGIIHRDIKPENILLQGGHAVVADFGIALAVQHAGGTRLTQTGLSLGTPQYMSPEQAMGEPAIDARSDVYALGAVTYEMLTGEPPFTGATVQAIVAKVLSSEPARPTEVRKTIPPSVEWAVLKALAKLPADRFSGAGQFGDALTASAATAMRADSGPVAAGPSVGSLESRRTRMWMRVAALMTVLAVGGAAGTGWAVRRAVERDVPLEYDKVLPDSAPIAFGKGSPWGESWTALAVSPRGDFVVYIADRGESTALWYRSLLDSTARPIAGTDSAYMIAMDPEGELIAFIAGKKLKVVPVGGGNARELGVVERPDGLTWLTRDRVLVSDADGGAFAFERLGGGARRIFTPACSMPQPASANAVFCAPMLVRQLADGADSWVTVRDEVGDGRAPPRLRGWSPMLLGEDHLIYSTSDGSVMAARWLPKELAVRGRATALSGVRTESVYWNRQAGVSVSGTLVYVPGAYNGRGQLVRANGREERVSLPVAPVTAEQFDVSVSGQYLALIVAGVGGMELRVVDLSTGRSDRWLQAPTLAEPRWSPDGKRLAVYASNDPDGYDGVTLVGDPLAGRAPDTLAGVSMRPSHWFAADRLLGYSFGRNPQDGRIMEVRLGPVVSTDTIKSSDVRQRGMISPDGRLIAYMSGDLIAVEEFPMGTRRTRVARGLDPLWLDSRTVVYRDGATWYRARVNTDAALMGQPERWFSDPRFVDTNVRSHALTPSGEIIYLRSIAPPTATHLRVVPKWAQAVRAAVAATERR